MFNFNFKESTESQFRIRRISISLVVRIIDKKNASGLFSCIE